mmetsp:Transcript_124530/g.248410  ORF Transcript_124530/g.248410 Transcript_124530/m.248410 type:complete len:375 (+) Transcript_124530:67-1191(+)
MVSDPWCVGIILEVLAGMCGCVGKLLVSFSSRTRKPLVARGCYWCGICITTLVGPLLDASAFSFAPQSIIAPLVGLDVCWTALLSPIILGDTLAISHYVGAILVSSGGGLTAVFGPHGAKIKTLEDAQSRLQDWPALVYAAFFLVYFNVCCIILRSRPVGVGDKARGILLGIMAGGLAGNMYFCSCVTGLFRHSLETGDWGAWQHWLPYILLVGTLGVGLGNIPLITRGLQEYETLFMVTLFEGCHILFACVSGALVLRETEQIQDSWQLASFWASILQICLGLYILQMAPLKGLPGERQMNGRTVSVLKPCRPLLSENSFDSGCKGIRSDSEASVVFKRTWSGFALSRDFVSQNGSIWGSRDKLGSFDSVPRL